MILEFWNSAMNTMLIYFMCDQHVHVQAFRIKAFIFIFL